jgi:hypothetical protein
MKALNDLMFSKKVNIQTQCLTLVAALFDCSGTPTPLLYFSVKYMLILLISETSKQVFRETGGVSSLLSVASSRNGAHLLALQALAKLAENNRMFPIRHFNCILVLTFTFSSKNRGELQYYYGSRRSECFG